MSGLLLFMKICKIQFIFFKIINIWCVFISNVLIEKNPRRPPQAYLVLAGCEPLTFTNIFPYWEKDSSIPVKVDDLHFVVGKRS